MIRRPPRSTRVRSSAASDVYKRQAHAGFGEQVAGASRVRFELAPQLSHVQPQVSTRGLVAGPPHLSEQLPLADEFAGVPQHDLEQVPLSWRKPHLNGGGAIGEGDTSGGQVNSG